MTKTPTLIDSYQAEINRLTEVFEKKGERTFCGAVCDSWLSPKKGGFLFGVCSPSRKPTHGGRQCGCLTQVRNCEFGTTNSLITEAIMADDRIPRTPYGIRHPDQLAVFREWQLRLDAELGRETPMVETTP